MTTSQVLRFVWASAGGLRAVIRSFDFYLAVIVWLLATPFWLSTKWPDQVIAVLPNLLGFTLGGFAIFLGFGGDEFKGVIAKADETRSPYLSVSSAFMLFVAVQISALLFAVVAFSMFAWPVPAVLHRWVDWIKIGANVGGGMGYFLFCYSLALVLRAAVRIFRLGRWHNAFLVLRAENLAAQESKDNAKCINPEAPS